MQSVSSEVQATEEKFATRRIKNRHKRCYELAAREMIYTKGFFSEWRLVHGTLLNLSFFGHAWLESEDRVWDPIFCKIFNKQEYYNVNNAKPAHSYSREEIGEWIRKEGHYGPWQDEV